MTRNKQKIAWALAAMVAFMAVQTLSINIKSANAQSYFGQTADDYFLQTLQELGYNDAVTFETDQLYDENLNENGNEYVFEVGELSGYALMINVFSENGNMYYDIMEIFVDAASPYATASGQKVYIKMFTYIEYIDGNYYDVDSGCELTAEQLEFAIEEGFEYRGVDTYTTTSETINYNTKDDVSFEFDYGLPAYTKSSYTNSCGNIAGGIIMGYYDIFYENIVPNFATGLTVGGKWRYLPQGTQVSSVIETLYSTMSIAANNGVTVSNFKSGITSYINGKGRSTAYNSVMSGGAFDYSSYVSQVSSGYPVAMFYSKFNLVSNSSFREGSGNDKLTVETYIANHVMIGSGYRNVKYYNSVGTNFRSDSYLTVSTGLKEKEKGFVRMNSNTIIDNAFGVQVY